MDYGIGPLGNVLRKVGVVKSSPADHLYLAQQDANDTQHNLHVATDRHDAALKELDSAKDEFDADNTDQDDTTDDS